MRDRNWGLVLGVLCGFVIFGVALLSGVSEETAFIRALLGSLVGGFVGYGFDYLAASAVPVTSSKGSAIDITLPDEGQGFEGPSEAGAKDFVPMDFIHAARVVQPQQDQPGD